MSSTSPAPLDPNAASQVRSEEIGLPHLVTWPESNLSRECAAFLAGRLLHQWRFLATLYQLTRDYSCAQLLDRTQAELRHALHRALDRPEPRLQSDILLRDKLGVTFADLQSEAHRQRFEEATASADYLAEPGVDYRACFISQLRTDQQQIDETYRTVLKELSPAFDDLLRRFFLAGFKLDRVFHPEDPGILLQTSSERSRQLSDYGMLPDPSLLIPPRPDLANEAAPRSPELDPALVFPLRRQQDDTLDPEAMHAYQEAREHLQGIQGLEPPELRVPTRAAIQAAAIRFAEILQQSSWLVPVPEVITRQITRIGRKLSLKSTPQWCVKFDDGEWIEVPRACFAFLKIMSESADFCFDKRYVQQHWKALGLGSSKTAIETTFNQAIRLNNKRLEGFGVKLESLNNAGIWGLGCLNAEGDQE